MISEIFRGQSLSFPVRRIRSPVIFLPQEGTWRFCSNANDYVVVTVNDSLVEENSRGTVPAFSAGWKARNTRRSGNGAPVSTVGVIDFQGGLSPVFWLFVKETRHPAASQSGSDAAGSRVSINGMGCISWGLSPVYSCH